MNVKALPVRTIPVKVFVSRTLLKVVVPVPASWVNEAAVIACVETLPA